MLNKVILTENPTSELLLEIEEQNREIDILTNKMKILERDIKNQLHRLVNFSWYDKRAINVAYITAKNALEELYKLSEEADLKRHWIAAYKKAIDEKKKEW